jgi:hypothetical protein
MTLSSIARIIADLQWREQKPAPRETERMIALAIYISHPDRGSTFRLNSSNERWCSSETNQFCVLVSLGGTTGSDQSLRYWIATKSEVGQLCVANGAHGTSAARADSQSQRTIFS